MHQQPAIQLLNLVKVCLARKAAAPVYAVVEHPELVHAIQSVC